MRLPILLNLLVSCLLLLSLHRAVTEAYPDADNYPWIEPGEDDARSPCPAINALANHGLINRDGKDVTVNDLASALSDAYGISYTLLLLIARVAVVGLPLGLLGFGVPHERDGLFQSARFDIDALFDDSVDHDHSLFRVDAAFGGTERSVNLCLVNELLNSTDDSEATTLTREDMVRFARRRRLDTRQNNPDGSTSMPSFAASSANVGEATLVFLMGTDPLMRIAKKDWVEEWVTFGRFPAEYEPRFGRTFNLLLNFPYFSLEIPSDGDGGDPSDQPMCLDEID